MLHAKTLLVVAAHDFEDVPLELVTETLALDLRGDALVVENAKLGLVGDLHLLLATRGGVGNVELHDDDGSVVAEKVIRRSSERLRAGG